MHQDYCFMQFFLILGDVVYETVFMQLSIIDKKPLYSMLVFVWCCYNESCMFFRPRATVSCGVLTGTATDESLWYVPRVVPGGWGRFWHKIDLSKDWLKLYHILFCWHHPKHYLGYMHMYVVTEKENVNHAILL